MKVSATLKGPKDEYNRRMVYIRIAEGNSRRFKATGIKVEESQWDKKVIKHPSAKSYNEVIKSLILKTESGLLTNKSPDVKFKSFALEWISRWEKEKKPSTISQLYTELKKFNEFTDVTLSNVTPQLLQKYREHLTGSNNTIWKSFKFLKTIMGKAVKERAISFNPFDVFDSPKYKDPPREYLTKEQVNKIEKYSKGKIPDPLKIASTWFLIGCYTGLRYSDQRAFSKTKIKGDRLIIYTTKTGQVVSIKMFPKLKELLERVDYKMPFPNQYYNQLLKTIAVVNNLPPLSVHMSRHTFGSLCAASGISQEVTAKLMGHNSLKYTSIYYHLSGTRLDEELGRIF